MPATDTSSPTHPAAAAPARGRWLALAGVAIASFLGCIDFTIVNTAIPAIQQDLGASIEASQWIVTAFVMALSTFMVAAGRVADLHGRRRALYAGMLLFGAASLGAGLAAHIGMLIAWRLVQGVACAALYTASTAIVAHAFPESERGRAIGLLFGANGLGLAIGPVAGGLLVDALSWRWIFLLNVPLVALAFALCLGRVQESRGAQQGETLDVAGLLLFLLALPCLLLAVVHGADWGWTSARTLGLAAAGIGLFAVLVRVSRGKASPLIRFDLFANLRFIGASAATFSLAFFYCTAFFLMPLYLGLIRHQDAGTIGISLLPTTVVMALVSPLAGRLADRRGAMPLLLAGFGFLATSALLQTHFAADTRWQVMLAAFVCMGLGWGAILGPSTMAALGSVQERLAGVAMGASWTLHNVGGALGLAAATSLYRAVAGPALQAASGLDAAQSMTLASDPLNALHTLTQHGVAPASATAWIAQSFLAGYEAAMWLLAGVCASACLMLAFSARRARSR